MEYFWQTNEKDEKHPSLKTDVSCDVVIIGGGLVGILCAFRLSKRGLHTVVLEKMRICSGTSGYSTAKITPLSGRLFTHTLENFGKDAVKLHGEFLSAGITAYEEFVEKYRIPCEYKKTPMYLYGLYGERLLEKEMYAANLGGIECRLTKDVPLPFKTVAGLVCENAAQINPREFVRNLTSGLEIYENTPVMDFVDGRIITPFGSVLARYTLSATNYPIFDKTKEMLAARCHRLSSYVCAFETDDELNGMFAGIDGGYNYRTGAGKLIVSGETHPTGEGTGDAYRRIISDTEKKFGAAKMVHKHSFCDTVTADGLPYIGYVGNRESKVFVVGGFGTWGLASSMSASEVVCDIICGHGSKFEELYSPKRMNIAASVDRLWEFSKTAVVSRSKTTFSTPEIEAEDLKNGQGAIIMLNGKKVGAYRDENGKLHKITPKCPHMGCELSWNSDDLTWDCPCHGSRFDVDGNVVCSPSVRKIDI